MASVAAAGFLRRRRREAQPTERHEQPDLEARRYTERLLGFTREELVRADTKASMLLAGAAAIVGALIAGIVAGDWSPTELTVWRELMWWTGSLAAAVALGLLSTAVYPRIRRRKANAPQIVGFFGDAVVFTDHGQLRNALERSARHDMDKLTDQVLQLSIIVMRKYRLLSASMWALLVAALGCCLGVILEALAASMTPD